MINCRTIDREMLGAAVKLKTATGNISYFVAREMADVAARRISDDPMLLAWYDKGSGDFSPRVECCSEKKPGWLVYAESRGGNVVIEINDLDYVFIYRT